MKLVIVITAMFLFCNSGAQNLSFNNSVYSDQGTPGSFLTPTIKIENVSTFSVEIILKRVLIDLPENWYTCFCFQTCHPPEKNSLHFFMEPGEIADVSVGFSTAMIEEGVGKVKLEIFDVLSGKRDTVEVTASTVTSGLTEYSNSGYAIYPNPMKGNLNIKSLNNVSSLQLIDSQGKIYQEFNNPAKTSTMDTEALPPAIYYLILIDKNGFRKQIPLIKE